MGILDILDILLIISIVLKLVGAVAWSWWVVLTPLWIGLGLYALGCVAIYVAGKAGK